MSDAVRESRERKSMQEEREQRERAGSYQRVSRQLSDYQRVSKQLSEVIH